MKISVTVFLSFYFWFYFEVLSVAGDTEFSEQWHGFSQLVWWFWKEGWKRHTAFLKCVHRSGCRCLCSGSMSGNFFKTCENEKLRITCAYHALCPKVISSMCEQVRHGLLAISGVCCMQLHRFRFLSLHSRLLFLLFLGLSRSWGSHQQLVL